MTTVGDLALHGSPTTATRWLAASGNGSPEGAGAPANLLLNRSGGSALEFPQAPVEFSRGEPEPAGHFLQARNQLSIRDTPTDDLLHKPVQMNIGLDCINS